MEGVRINFVRAMSRGARRTPAIPAAETDTMREFKGDGEERMSRPPVAVEDGDMEGKESPGSGRASSAARKERKNDVDVDRRSE